MQKAWFDSYNNPKHRKMLFPHSPTGAGTIFLDYLHDHDYFFNKPLLDIGCGNGRNAIALADKGFDIYGIDGISGAIKEANAQMGLEQQRFVVGDLGKPWPYTDNQFAYAIDINTFSSLSTDTREVYISELVRVLKSEGLFFLYTYTIRDGYYSQFIKEEDENIERVSILCSDDGVARALYSVEALKDLFSNYFTCVHEEPVVRYSKMFDTYYKRHFVALIFQKV